MLSLRRGSLFSVTVAFVLVSFLSVTVVAPVAEASERTEGPVSEDGFNEESIDRGDDRALVDRALEREKVREKLNTLGFTVKGIKERLSRLSDEEIHRMARRIEQVKAGGHLGFNELNLAILIVLIVLAPILAVVWGVLVVLGHDVHLHHQGGHVH